MTLIQAANEAGLLFDFLRHGDGLPEVGLEKLVGAEYWVITVVQTNLVASNGWCVWDYVSVRSLTFLASSANEPNTDHRGNEDT